MQTLLLSLWHETGKKVLLITHDIEEAVFMATELILLSPGPGRVLERLARGFCCRANPAAALNRTRGLSNSASTSSAGYLNNGRLSHERGHQ